jgi:hypothetical protein
MFCPSCIPRNRSAVPASRRELMMSRLVVSVVAAQMKLTRGDE